MVGKKKLRRGTRRNPLLRERKKPKTYFNINWEVLNGNDRRVSKTRFFFPFQVFMTDLT